MVVLNHSTLIRIRERAIILNCVGSSLGDKGFMSPNWVRERLGQGVNKDLRPVLIFKVCHLLLLYCSKLVVAISTWAHHCHSCVSHIINGLFLLSLTNLDVTNLCLIANCLFLIRP